MKKCKGCGALLQNESIDLAGYVVKDNQEYCQRCFRLIHYGDLKNLNKLKVNNEDVFNIYKEHQKNIFILIVDVFDALILDQDALLDIYRDYKVILVINKIDLLPKNITEEKLENIYSNILSNTKYNNIISCLLTYKGDPNFNTLFFDLLSEQKETNYLFVGRVNAGKSTIINKLIGSNDLTTSTYPGTTVNINTITFDNYCFIDTPGLNDEESFVNYIDKNQIQFLFPNKCIKPKTFQLYDKQSYIIEGLVRVDIIPKKNSSIKFIINNEIEPHRTNIDNGENYINKHQKEFIVKLLPLYPNRFVISDEKAFVIKGLGYIKVQGKCDININVYNKIKIYTSEVNL